MNNAANNNSKAKKIFDGRFEILGIIGRGARSVVYKARNIVDGGPDVALKVLLSDKDSNSTRDKLRKEALAMVSCHHSYVVKLDDFHSVGDLSYLSMEYAPLSDLRRYSESLGGKLPIEQIENYFIQTTRALEYIHSVGIIHRDIKPDNLLIVSESELRVGDFGIALLPGDEQSPAAYKNAVGTMDYMAPEILEGKPCDKKTDIYALGVTFAELVLGKSLFADVPLVEQLTSREDKNLPLFDGIPTHIKKALLSCLAYDREERAISGKEVLQILTDKSVNEVPKSEPIKMPKKEINPVVEIAVEKTESEIKEFNTAQEKVHNAVASTTAEPIKVVSSKAEIKEAPKPPVEASKKSSTPVESNMAETVVIDPKTIKEQIAVSPVKETPAKQLMNLTKSYSSLVFALPFIAFCLGLLLFKMNAAPKDGLEGTTQIQDSEKSVEAKDLRIASKDGILDMSLLPTGIYVGSVSRVHPAIQKAPLYIVSDLENARLIILLGIPGWKPTVLSTAGLDLRTLRVSSGGIVLELSRLITNDGKTVQGTVKNLSLGAEGEISFMEQ